MLPCEVMLQVAYGLNNSLKSFSTDGSLTSGPCRVLEKNATGDPARFRIAAKATSEASVSTSNDKFSCIAVRTDSSMLFLRLSKAATASVDNGKVLLELIGFILSENPGIHCE